ncbi:MAG: TIM-barrel domain-containing protein [Pseudomonadota bacterium]
MLQPIRTLRRTLMGITLCCASAWADYGDYRSHRVEGQTLIVDTTLGQLSVSVVHPTAMYLHFAEPGRRQLPGYALSGDSVPSAVVVSETDQSLMFTTAALSLSLSKETMTAAFFLEGEPLVTEAAGYYAFETVRGFRFALQDGEKILGGGERVLGMDRRGERMPLYNRAHYGYNGASSQMYYSLPAVMSDRNYALVFDNSARGALDIGHTRKDILGFEASAGRTAYLISAGTSMPSLVESLTAAVGRQPLPPRWAFGNFASRFGYHSEAETRAVVERFRQQSIPLDAVVLDLYWFGPDIIGHMGRLDWDRNAFPDPERMLRDFAQDGIKTVLISEPFILTSSTRWDEAQEAGILARSIDGGARLFDFYFGNTGLVDVFADPARRWLWNIYRDLHDQGVAGIWGDLGEPEVHPADTLHTISDSDQQATADEVHNVYGHEWARLVYENHRRDYPTERPFIMMRSGFIGTQRYGIIPWTGDVERSWSGLQTQTELSLQMGLFGLGYIHSDLGGFAGGDSFDRELYTRWLQMGTYQPVFRPHAQEHIAPEPIFHDRRTRKLAKAAIDQRYRLLPYLQTLAFENTITGLPFVRPLMFDDPALFDHTASYLFGNAFHVTPITEPGVRATEITLPSGVWFDFADDTRLEGGVHRVAAPLQRIPVMVRAGAFVPMTPLVQTTQDYSSESLILHYYDDRSVTLAGGQLFEDDGESPTSIEDGTYDLLRFAAARDDRQLVLELARLGRGYAGMPVARNITLVVHNQEEPPAQILLDGVPLVEPADSDYDSRRKQLRIRLTQADATRTVVIRYAP